MTATRDAWNYFYGEIAEEGELSLAFEFLRREHGWTIDQYQRHVSDAVRSGSCALNRWRVTGESFGVEINEIDFSSLDGMRFISFVPTDKAWDAYNGSIGPM